jgi:hypothetical protein
MPECALRPSDCEDVGVINTLDGFNMQPRLSIPFDGPIDVATVTRSQNGNSGYTFAKGGSK